MTIELKPRLLFRSLMGFILFLLLANIVVNIIDLNYFQNGGFLSSNKYVKVLIQLFDFDTEVHNIPTFYSSLALLFCAILLWIIAKYSKANDQNYFYWLSLALLFIYISLDEILALHEHLDRLTQKALGMPGDELGYWIIPYIAGLLILGLLFLKFLSQLPKKTLQLFLLSGLVFISGAVGFELWGLKYASGHGMSNSIYVLFYTIEEFLEMLGVIIFIYALTSHRSFLLKVN